MSTKGLFASLSIGLLLSIAIWFAVPYNNFAFNNSFVCDGYLPEIVLLFIAILVLVVNPLLRKFAPQMALSHACLALITGILLFAAVLPGNGLMRFFPHCLAHDTEKINEDMILAEAVVKSDLPPALFPDKIGADLDTPVSSQLVDELDDGKSIPWRAWLKPGIAWGTVIVAFWVLMLGMGSIIFKQWRDNERLPFPLLRVYHAMIEEPESGRIFPEVFRSKLFWIGALAVFLIHSSNGLKLFTDGNFPAFPVTWDISDLFTEGIWRGAPGFLKGSRIYFLFVGLAYFMPSRYSFSIWFTILFFGLFVMACRQYVPTFEYSVLYDQGAGALLAVACGIAWLGRAHYIKVLRGAFRGPLEVSRTEVASGRMFLLGGLVMYLWFVWAGAGLLWSMLFVVIGIVIMLTVSRIVAETGITYVWIIPLTVARLIGVLPHAWQTVSTAFLQQAHYILANRASAVSVAAITAMAMGLNRTSSEKSRGGLLVVGIVVLLLGLFICGAVHMDMGYNLATSYDGVNAPITGRGARVMGIRPASMLAAGSVGKVDMLQVRWLAWGFVLGAVLLFLCARFPNWPLHPIGLIFVHSSIGLRLVVSLFFGWLLKTLLVNYFGARAYKAAMPMFLGFIFGEIFASALWILVPIIQILLGADPSLVPRMVIFQYT